MDNINVVSGVLGSSEVEVEWIVMEDVLGGSSIVLFIVVVWDVEGSVEVVVGNGVGIISEEDMAGEEEEESFGSGVDVKEEEKM